MNSKFIIPVTGPIMSYRLDIYKKVCPEIRDMTIFLTDKFSYDNNFQNHRDFFHFVILDEYRKDDKVSLEYEKIFESHNENQFYKNLTKFYNETNNRWYPLDIHRFIFPYLIKNQITNFNITQSDFIFKNDKDILKKFFDDIPSGVIYGPWHDEDVYQESRMSLFNKIQPKFTDIKFESPFLRTCDGWMRGFHFKNLDDMNLFYKIWNESLSVLYTERDDLNSHGNLVISHTEWIFSYISQFFEKQLNYEFSDCYKYLPVSGFNQEIGRHYSRVEDTIYSGVKPYWDNFNFNWSDMSSISNFIKNNKEQIFKYYDGTFKKIEITDTHVYTSLT